MKRVEVTWRDSTTRGGWAVEEEYKKFGCLTIKSVGFLLHRSKERILLLQSQDGRAKRLRQYSDGLAIPKGCIEKVEEI